MSKAFKHKCIKIIINLILFYVYSPKIRDRLAEGTPHPVNIIRMGKRKFFMHKSL